MRLINASWTPQVNYYILRCVCGREFSHPADKWWAECPDCHHRAHLSRVRDAYAAQPAAPEAGSEGGA